jgi:hypothetical protein
MDTIYRKFFRNFYTKTNGYIPVHPLNGIIYPGDFFQIRNGEMIFLGNVFSSGIIDTKNIDFQHDIKLASTNWDFSEDVTKPYSGRGTGHNAISGEFEFSKQVLAFNSPGSFFFRGSDPEAVKIGNWNDIQSEAIIKLTQTYFSFREIYIATETVSMSQWSLAISSSAKGELEIAIDEENYGLVDIFGHVCAKTIQSKDIEYYNRQAERKASFFKAKKLVVQNEKLETFIEEYIYKRGLQGKWAADFYSYEQPNRSEPNPMHNTHQAETNTLDLLPGNQLNPNTALLYFKWANASLDDIEKLFLPYGD